MTRPRLLRLAAALLALFGVCAYEADVIRSQRASHALLLARLTELERQFTTLRQTLESTDRERLLAEQQLAQIVSATESADGLARATEMRSWLVRVKQLRQLVADQPERRIPEMQLLTDEDWLQVARVAAFETEHDRRKAYAALRAASKSRFALQLSAALSKFIRQSNGQFPATALDLASCFAAPVDIAALQRYAPVPGTATVPSRTLHEISAIDDAYDVRQFIPAKGEPRQIGPSSWNNDEDMARLSAASRAYFEAHHGASFTSVKQLMPYITQPVSSSTLDKLLKAERDRAR